MENKNEKIAFPSRESLRLELVKLTYAHGRNCAEAVGRAKELEDYVLEPGPSEEKKKKSGNAKSL